MATQHISDEAIFKATGAPWSHWMEVFSLMDAKSLPHKEIARKLHEDHKVPGWWCQMLTVKFEYEIGRREPNHSEEGEYQVGVSITVPGEMDELYEHWTHELEDRAEYNKVQIVAPAALSQTDSWRYWRLRLRDNSRVYVDFSNKSEGKVLVRITHEKLTNDEDVEKWRLYWKSVFEDVFKHKA